MTFYDIAGLKAAQDVLQRRADDLMSGFAPFRDGLIELLERFTAEATQADLNGTSRLQRKRSTDEIVEATLTLNDFELVLVATNEAYPDSDNDPLSAKVFLFHAGDETNRPHIEVAFQELGKDSYRYSMTWLTPDERRFITGGRILTKEECRTAGADVAEVIIGHFVRFTTMWAQNPTLGMMLQKRGQSRSIGFPTPEN